MRARLGFYAGLVLVVAGLFLTLGLGWALVVAGLGTGAAFVWLYDVTEPEKPERLSRVRRGGDDW